MGLIMSSMGKGLPLEDDSTEMLRFLVQTCNRSNDKEIKGFHEFHVTILDIFNAINSGLPGKHYDVPSFKEVEECFKDWEKAKCQEEKRKLFVDFIKGKKINLSEVEDSRVITEIVTPPAAKVITGIEAPPTAMVITGLVTPPAAMVAKRVGEKVPQLKAIKAIPDDFFVPSATVLALISVKFFGRLFMGNTAS